MLVLSLVSCGEWCKWSFSFFEFCIWVENSPQIHPTLQFRKCSCPAFFPPKPRCSLSGTTVLIAWLAVQDVVRSEIASQHISAIDQRGAPRWGVQSASPRRFTLSYSGLYSHFCEYTGIFLVYSTNKIILCLILSIAVPQIARRGHSPSDWALARGQLRPEASNFCEHGVQHTVWLIHDDREAHLSEQAEDWQPDMLEFSV